MRGGSACQTLRNTSEEVHFPKLLVWRKYEPFFLFFLLLPNPQFVSCHLLSSFPSTNLLLDSAAV